MLYVKQQHTFVLGYISNHFFLKLAFLYSFSTYIRLVWFFFATYKNYFTVRKLPLFVTVLGSGSSATANVCEVSEPRAESWFWRDSPYSARSRKTLVCCKILFWLISAARCCFCFDKYRAHLFMLWFVTSSWRHKSNIELRRNVNR